MLKGETQVTMKCPQCQRYRILYFDKVNACFRCPACDEVVLLGKGQLELFEGGEKK